MNLEDSIHKDLNIPRGNMRQLYLSYLKTATLVTLVNDCEDRIFLAKCEVDKRRRELYQTIRDDAVCELRGRQLELFAEPPNSC